jgi:hypothetical protein
VDKETLFKRRAADRIDTVDLGDFVVTIRALTTAQVNLVKDQEDELRNRRIVSWSMVDPELTPAEAGEWMEIAPAGDIVKVIEAVTELSGLGEGAGKSGLPTTGE